MCSLHSPRVSGSALSHLVGPGSVLAAERVLPVPELLRPLFPGAGIQRGSLVGISGRGSGTLLSSVLAAPLAEGSWAAVVGLPDLGLEAAGAAGVDLRRLAHVPDPGPRWPAVAAVLLDALDVVVVRPPGSCRPSDARRLAARAREQGSVLFVVGEGASWPERPDIELRAEAGDWEGLGQGAGTLRRRPAEILATGRRGGDRPRSVSCWLPGEEGRLAPRRSREPAVAPVIVSEALSWAG